MRDYGGGSIFLRGCLSNLIVRNIGLNSVIRGNLRLGGFGGRREALRD